MNDAKRIKIFKCNCGHLGQISDSFCSRCGMYAPPLYKDECCICQRPFDRPGSDYDQTYAFNPIVFWTPFLEFSPKSFGDVQWFFGKTRAHFLTSPMKKQDDFNPNRDEFDFAIEDFWGVFIRELVRPYFNEVYDSLIDSSERMALIPADEIASYRFLVRIQWGNSLEIGSDIGGENCPFFELTLREDELFHLDGGRQAVFEVITKGAGSKWSFRSSPEPSSCFEDLDRHSYFWDYKYLDSMVHAATFIAGTSSLFDGCTKGAECRCDLCVARGGLWNAMRGLAGIFPRNG